MIFNPAYLRHDPEFDPVGNVFALLFLLCCLTSGVRHANRQDQLSLLALAHANTAARTAVQSGGPNRATPTHRWRLRSKLRGTHLEQYPVFALLHQIAYITL
jgi:hypothetical protein